MRVLVGTAGFEPATSSSRTRRATSLRYAPIGRNCAVELVLIQGTVADLRPAQAFTVRGGRTGRYAF